MRRALLAALRGLHLIGWADQVAAFWAETKMASANAAYRRAHPLRAFPRPALVFEVAGHASLQQFDLSGASHAKLIAALAKEAGLPQSPCILEWGCGPGRILSHLANEIDAPSADYFGCDPDARAIAFLRAAMPSMRFEPIGPLPPTPYSDGAFDLIFGVSIFTHLSRASARSWAAELARLVRDSGCAIVTTHGARAAQPLAPQSRARFEAGDYVVLGGARVGSRTYASYFNEAVGRALFEPWFHDVDHVPAGDGDLAQDVWVLKSPRRSIDIKSIE